MADMDPARRDALLAYRQVCLAAPRFDWQADSGHRKLGNTNSFRTVSRIVRPTRPLASAAEFLDRATSFEDARERLH